jgi:hypothetical protein
LTSPALETDHDLVTNKTVNGVAYNVYTYGDTNAELWIQERVTLRKMQCGFVINGFAKYNIRFACVYLVT